MTECKADYIVTVIEPEPEQLVHCGRQIGQVVRIEGKAWMMLGDIPLDYLRGVCPICRGRITFNQLDYDLARLTRSTVAELDKKIPAG